LSAITVFFFLQKYPVRYFDIHRVSDYSNTGTSGVLSVTYLSARRREVERIRDKASDGILSP